MKLADFIRLLCLAAAQSRWTPRSFRAFASLRYGRRPAETWWWSEGELRHPATGDVYATVEGVEVVRLLAHDGLLRGRRRAAAPPRVPEPLNATRARLRDLAGDAADGGAAASAAAARRPSRGRSRSAAARSSSAIPRPPTTWRRRTTRRRAAAAARRRRRGARARAAAAHAPRTAGRARALSRSQPRGTARSSTPCSATGARHRARRGAGRPRARAVPRRRARRGPRRGRAEARTLLHVARAQPDRRGRARAPLVQIAPFAVGGGAAAADDSPGGAGLRFRESYGPAPAAERGGARRALGALLRRPFGGGGGDGERAVVSYRRFGECPACGRRRQALRARDHVAPAARRALGRRAPPRARRAARARARAPARARPTARRRRGRRRGRALAAAARDARAFAALPSPGEPARRWWEAALGGDGAWRQLIPVGACFAAARVGLPIRFWPAAAPRSAARPAAAAAASWGRRVGVGGGAGVPWRLAAAASSRLFGRRARACAPPASAGRPSRPGALTADAIATFRRRRWRARAAAQYARFAACFLTTYSRGRARRRARRPRGGGAARAPRASGALPR